MLSSTVSDPASPATKRRPRVSVVVPTYNEAKNPAHVFALLPEDLHEVVVDSNSVDDMIAVVRQNRIGKGNAMACGFAAVRATSW